MPRTPVSAQKRQTKLSFAAVAGASNASPGLSPARVQIASVDSPSPAKRRRVTTAADSLPTPAPSSQLDGRRSTRSSAAAADQSKSSFMKTTSSKNTRHPRNSRHTIDFGDSESEEDNSTSPHRSAPPAIHQGDEIDSENESSDSEGEEDDDDLPRSRQRRPPANTQQEEDDLKEDLDFLKTYSPPPVRQATSAKAARQQALEALKRRRSNQSQDTHSPAQRRPVVIESDEEVEDYDSSSNSSLPDIFQADESDEGFLDDENDTGSAPALPLEFSNYQTMKPKELFKFVIEWMVQKKINPAFAMEDEVYALAFQRLDDFVRGLGGSKYQSSAWTPEFTKSLKTRPKLRDVRMKSGIAIFEHDRCDACNRSGHPATWEVKFVGHTYDAETLEDDTDHESDGDDDDDDSDVSDEANATTYYVGKTCMSNARIAHALAHWKYALMEWVIEYLRDEGHLDPEKIVQRDGWSTRRRRQYAEGVVDNMAANGQISSLHKEFRSNIDTAQRAGNETLLAYSSL